MAADDSATAPDDLLITLDNVFGTAEQDAQRRDFTFNALYADAEGTIYDYFDGRADLVAGRVRFIGDPDRRIAEDHLRVLRFFRFYAWFGQPPLDAASSRMWRPISSSGTE